MKNDKSRQPPQFGSNNSSNPLGSIGGSPSGGPNLMSGFEGTSGIGRYNEDDPNSLHSVMRRQGYEVPSFGPSSGPSSGPGWTPDKLMGLAREAPPQPLPGWATSAMAGSQPQASPAGGGSFPIGTMGAQPQFDPQAWQSTINQLSPQSNQASQPLLPQFAQQQPTPNRQALMQSLMQPNTPSGGQQ